MRNVSGIKYRGALMFGRRGNRLRQGLNDERAYMIAAICILLSAWNRLCLGKESQTCLGIVEHVPGVSATSLDRFHVVLDCHDRIRETIDRLLRQRHAIV